ncbi:MAG: hypothetical protein FJ387_18575 [Verrucomicrobia bacterium]|nr:hypothetical protein [Verrucomicrobiota bacterium]
MRLQCCLIPAALSAAASSMLLTQAENWPQFRGPTGQGISIEENLPLAWSPTSNVVWKSAIPGEGWSSPIVWDDHVFVTTATEDGGRFQVLDLDRRTGQVLWDRTVFEATPQRKERKNSHATATPVTDGRRVYVVAADGKMAALDFAGRVVWTHREVEYYSRHGLGASPIVYQGLVIMPFDGSNRVKEPGQWPNNSDEERLGWQIPWDRAQIVALDCETGRRVWTGRRGRSRIAHATPVVFREEGVDRLLSVAGDAVQCFDLRSGERLWTVYCQGEGLVPTPVVGEGLAFTASGFEKTTLRGIRIGGAGEVTDTHIAWEQRRGVPTQASPLFVQSRLYAVTDGGVLTCFAANDGSEVYQERVGGNYSASPVFAEGRLYLLNEAGETVVVAAGPQFQILARNPLGEKCQASPAISQGHFFIRTERQLFCLGGGPPGY